MVPTMERSFLFLGGVGLGCGVVPSTDIKGTAKSVLVLYALLTHFCRRVSLCRFVVQRQRFDFLRHSKNDLRRKARNCTDIEVISPYIIKIGSVFKHLPTKVLNLTQYVFKLPEFNIIQR